MVKIEMAGFRIKNLSILNDIEENGEVRLRSSFDFTVDYDKDSEAAVAVLTERIELDGYPEQYHIELALEGAFQVSGVKNNSDRKAAHLKFYDSLFPYADQILACLVLNCGFAGLRLQKHEMDLENIHFGEKPEKKPGKVIEMKIEK